MTNRRRNGTEGLRMAILVLALAVLTLCPSSATAAGEFEPNDTRETAFGPLAGGTDYAATFETDNDVDWFVFYIKTYSQMDFSGSTSCNAWHEVVFALKDKDGQPYGSFEAGVLFGEDHVVEHMLMTINPGRYYFKIENWAGECTGHQIRIRIDPATAITTSRECGEAIVARDMAAPLLADANSDLAKSSELLAAEAANVHKAKKELRRTSQKAQRLKQKVKRLGKRGSRSRKLHRTKRRNRKLHRTTRYLREVRRTVKNNIEWLEKAKAKRRPVWQEKRSLEAIAAQHQQAIATADGQIATYC